MPLPDFGTPTPEWEGHILSVNRRSYPSEGRTYISITVVLVVGGIGDYAAYIGEGAPEFVARHGNKLSFEEACVHFPVGLERHRYRE